MSSPDSPPRNVDEINARLLEISRQILPDNLTLVYLPVESVREQDKNAQAMPQKMFEQLVSNVKEAGVLESVPLCVKHEGQVYMISGHHRLRAVRAAKVTHILVLLYDNLSKSRIRSKQLAHNSIIGMSDPEIVRQLFGEITDIQAKFEAFIDPHLFDSLPKPVTFKPVDVQMQEMVKGVFIIFLPSQKIDVDAALEMIWPKTQVDAVYLASRESYEEWKAALQKVRDDLDIVSLPTALAEMASLAVEALQSRQAGKAAPEQGAQE